MGCVMKALQFFSFLPPLFPIIPQEAKATERVRVRLRVRARYGYYVMKVNNYAPRAWASIKFLSCGRFYCN